MALLHDNLQLHFPKLQSLFLSNVSSIEIRNYIFCWIEMDQVRRHCADNTLERKSTLLTNNIF